jgi:hypothetical protein
MGGTASTRASRCPDGQCLYRVFRAGVTGWKLVCARDEERAAKRVRGSTKAVLVRPSSYWQKERALGNYPVRSSKRHSRRKV